MAEDDHKKKNPLKLLEALGKDVVNEFLDSLVEKNVLKVKEEDKQKYHGAKAQDKARVLVSSLRDKKEEAVQVLLETCLHLEGKPTHIEAPPAIKAEPAESAESIDTLKLCPHEDFLRLSKERAEEIYPIKEKKDRTRLALIICNTEFDHLAPRHGADHDIVGMKGLLEGLGYSVNVKEKLTARGMESVLREFAARPEHKSSDSTFVVLMSHGILDGICGTRHSEATSDVLPYDTVFQIFNNRNCVSLKDKPKVIIVQACRGDNVSWRDITSGSLFITQLITYFRKYSWCCHLQEVFRKVQQSFETPSVRAQMPTIERLSMTRYFYLFPGN
ncbi:caspase-13-like isoform X2 [Lemur catta]|uniref:caspase-13-like isoform X2 n=1 Tax=Lemur catta TaxID=9447 RepID=UPI001E26A606|nr:caspase-13-like isoform X2 [Lemur catta]